MDPDSVARGLEAAIDSHLARRATRSEDWETLAFQSRVDQRYARAQVRYVGSGGTGDHSHDPTILPSTHFTFSNMILPVGHEGPPHVHDDVEEVFFIIEGTLVVAFHANGVTAERELGYRDLILIPPGVSRSIRNPGPGTATIAVILGSPRPQLPTYPEGTPLAGALRD